MPRKLDVQQWNNLVKSVQRQTLRGGTGVTVGSGNAGQYVSARNNTASTMDHPWKVAVGWDSDAEQYFFQMVPGCVNGRPAKVPMTDPEDKTKVLLVDVLEIPKVPIPNSTWIDGTQMPLRPFFTSLGVTRTSSTAEKLDAVQSGTTITEQAPGKGLLRCEVVLTVSKMIANGELTGIGDEVMTSYSISGNSVDVRQNTARIHVASQYSRDQPAMEIGPGEIPQEPLVDEVRLATLYLVNETPGTMDVTGEEDVYVAQGTFWNLGYVPFLTLLNYQGVTINPNLAAAGVGIFGALAEIGRLETLMSMPFGVKPPSNAGYFWTQ
jgi:hypothetical protein